VSSAGLSPVFLWRLARPFRSRAASVLALMVVDSALASVGIGLILPVTGALLLGEGQPAQNPMFALLGGLSYRERVLWLSALVLAVFALKAAVSFGHVLLARDFAERMRCFWMERIGERYLNGRFGEVAMRRQGAVVNDWFNEPAAAARFLLAYMGYLSGLLLTVALLAISLAVDWRVTLGFVAAGGVAALTLSRGAYGRIARLSGVKLEHNQALGAEISENVGQLREIKLLGLEARRLDDVRELAQRLKRVFVRLSVMGEAPRIAGELGAVTVFVATLVVLITAGREAREIVPLLAFFFVAFYRLVTSAMQVVSGRIKALSDLRSVELVDRLSADSYDPEGSAGHPIARIEGDIRFEEVDFSYDGSEQVLRGVSFTLARGRVTCLLGPSGAGKSTILDLLLRLYKPAAGRIVANDRDIESFDLRQWRRRLGYVSQDAALFNGSVRMNVHLGRPDAPECEIVEACRLAGAQDFLSELPAGLDTAIGHRGYSLSGGQAKRIAIARMLLRQPDFLILDEATSAFEQDLESAIIHRVRARYPDMGIVQISHRLVSARNADHVVSLDQGRVTAAGSPADMQALQPTVAAPLTSAR
jgi:ABC-type multidrug transport system fused ATPase/permease subunit